MSVKSCAGVLLAVALGLASAVVQANRAEVERYVCERGDQVRTVRLVRVSPPAAVPCEVWYRKPSERPDMNKRLWRAEKDGAFCEHKAKAFVKKLEGWNWSCSLDSDTIN